MRLPAQAPGRAWIYLVGLPDGGIKAGRTISLHPRMASHNRTFGGIEWLHFMPVEASRVDKIEGWVLERLGNIGRQRKRTEVFDDISKGDAIETARCVIACFMTPEEYAAHKQAKLMRDVERIHPFVNAMLAELAKAPA